MLGTPVRTKPAPQVKLATDFSGRGHIHRYAIANRDVAAVDNVAFGIYVRGIIVSFVDVAELTSGTRVCQDVFVFKAECCIARGVIAIGGVARFIVCGQGSQRLLATYWSWSQDSLARGVIAIGGVASLIAGTSRAGFAKVIRHILARFTQNGIAGCIVTIRIISRFIG